MSNTSSSPQHIAIIMDGNRRWAKQHKRAALQGHEYVVDKVIEPLVDQCIKLGIPYLTLWAFSTENWRRDKQEVDGLMELFRRAFSRNANKLHQKGVRLHTIGDLSKFPSDIQTNVTDWLAQTHSNTTITVTFALNYGGRDEIIRAIKKASKEMADNKEMPESNWSEAVIGGYLDTAGLPDPDLIIRPGGEQRLSGFLPWQSVYSELYFSDVLMPDFGPEELIKAIEDYQRRRRRFGK